MKTSSLPKLRGIQHPLYMGCRAVTTGTVQFAAYSVHADLVNKKKSVRTGGFDDKMRWHWLSVLSFFVVLVWNARSSHLFANSVATSPACGEVSRVNAYQVLAWVFVHVPVVNVLLAALFDYKVRCIPS
jgi:hypothetical protein